MSNLSYSDSFINFGKLLENDPEELSRLNRVLDASIATRNTITLSEFKRYELIFKLDGRDILGNDNYDSLCREYFRRVTPYHPVYIVNNDDEVVLTLPAVFNSVSCVSDVGEAGCNAIVAFTNANEATDEFNIKKKTYTEYLSRIFDAAQDPEALQKKREDAAKHVENFKALQLRPVEEGEVVSYKPEEISNLDQGLSDEVEYL